MGLGGLASHALAGLLTEITSLRAGSGCCLGDLSTHPATRGTLNHGQSLHPKLGPVVYEWAESRPRVTSSRRGDTLWVTLRRPGSTKRCSPLYPLSAGFVEKQGELRLIHLASSCPSLSRTKTERF